MGRHGRYNNKKPHALGLEIPSPVTDVLDCYQYKPPSPEIDSSYFPKPFNVAVVRFKRAGAYQWEIFSHPEEARLDKRLREESKTAEGVRVFAKYTRLNKNGMEIIERTVGRHQGKNPPQNYDTVLSPEKPKPAEDSNHTERMKPIPGRHRPTWCQ